MVYLDYSATSPLLPCVKKAMEKAMDLAGNPSALHTPGHLAMNVIEDAREEIAKLINAEPDEILFTSGGSESNNTVTNIFANQPVAISAIEHPSLLESAKLRCKATVIPVNNQGLIAEQFFSPTKPKLVSIMLANNEIGSINDVKSLAKKAHKSGALFHTDATQALGKIKIDVKDLDVDYMTLSSHKIGGPIGIGALYIKKGSIFRPFIIGGHQEKGRRAGTYQTVNIAGFGAAAKFAREHKTWETYAKTIRPLRDLLAKRILEEIPYSSINGLATSEINTLTLQSSTTPKSDAKSKTINFLPNILSCSFEAAEGESIQLYLDAEGGIITSTGSACAAGDGKPSHVLMATTGDVERAHSSIRFSFGLDSSQQDIDHVMQYLPDIVKRLQGISTIKIKDKHYEK